MRRLAFLLAANLAALASPAIAEPINSFKAFCLTAGGDAAAAEAAARADGWTPNNMADNPSMRVLQNTETSSEAPPELIMLGSYADAGLNVEACSILAQIEQNSVEAAIEASLGFAPVRSEDGSPIWVFTRTLEGFQSQNDLTNPSDEEMREAVQQRGPIASVMIRQEAAGLVIAHFLVKP